MVGEGVGIEVGRGGTVGVAVGVELPDVAADAPQATSSKLRITNIDTERSFIMNLSFYPYWRTLLRRDASSGYEANSARRIGYRKKYAWREQKLSIPQRRSPTTTIFISPAFMIK
jgi:hypothetical protein